MEGRKPIKLPADVWERVKRKAEREGKSMGQVLREILDQIPEEDETVPRPKECVYCGNPTTPPHRICDPCYFDPFVIRPQSFVAIYYHFAMAIAPDAGLKGTFDEFIEWLSEKIAKEFYGVRDDEWEVWQEWLGWRKAFLNNETTPEDPEWRRFVVWTNKDGYCGDRAAWRILTMLFGVVRKE